MISHLFRAGTRQYEEYCGVVVFSLIFFIHLQLTAVNTFLMLFYIFIPFHFVYLIDSTIIILHRHTALAANWSSVTATEGIEPLHRGGMNFSVKINMVLNVHRNHKAY